MANLLVKTAETVTTKKIAFPTFKVDDSARKIAKKVATYMGKVRAASKADTSVVSIEDVSSLLKKASDEVRDVIRPTTFNAIPNHHQDKLIDLISRETDIDKVVEDDEPRRVLSDLPVLIMDLSGFDNIRHDKEYRLIFDDTVYKVKGFDEATRYYYKKQKEPGVVYSCVSYSYFQLMLSCEDYKVNYSGHDCYVMVGNWVRKNYQEAFSASLNALFAAASEKTIATITSDKIYQDEELNNHTIFNQTGFRKCEIDTEKYQGRDFDKQAFQAIEQDWLKLCNKLPHSKQEPEFKMRKLGKHKATGLYYPYANILAVDVRSTNSFIHEYGHYLDFTYQENGETISVSNAAFKEVRYLYEEALNDLVVNTQSFEAKAIEKKWSYYTTPTEVFARAFELWVHFKIDSTTELTKNGKPNGESKGYSGLEYRAFSKFIGKVYHFFENYFNGFEEKQKFYSVEDVDIEKVEAVAVSYHVFTKEVEPTNVGEQLSLFDF